MFDIYAWKKPKQSETHTISLNNNALMDIASYSDDFWLVLVYDGSNIKSKSYLSRWNSVARDLKGHVNVAEYDLSLYSTNQWVAEEYDADKCVLVKLFTPHCRNYGEAETYFEKFNEDKISFWAQLNKEDYAQNRSVVPLNNSREVYNCFFANGTLFLDSIR